MRAMLIAAALAAAPVQPSPVTLGDFLARYAAMKAETDRPAQLVELAQLIDLIGAASNHYRQELDAARATGAPPRACPVRGTGDDFTLDAFAAALAAMPEAQRAEPFEEAAFRFMDARHPCPDA